MKNLKSYITVIIILMIGCTNNIFAQSNSKNNIPAAVVTAFTAKYPNAAIKKWNVNNDGFTARAIDGHQKFYASFNQNGEWLNTTSSISWSWNLPSEVRAALKSSKYAAWRVDGIKKVESPSAGVYQVCVDNADLQPDGAHALVFTENKVVTFKPSGEILSSKSIQSPLLF